MLHPGDPARTAYEELLNQLGVSGAEVIRLALVKLREQTTCDPSGRQLPLQEAV